MLGCQFVSMETHVSSVMVFIFQKGKLDTIIPYLGNLGSRIFHTSSSEGQAILDSNVITYQYFVTLAGEGHCIRASITISGLSAVTKSQEQMSFTISPNTFSTMDSSGHSLVYFGTFVKCIPLRFVLKFTSK